MKKELSILICDDDAITRSVLQYQATALLSKKGLKSKFYLTETIKDAFAICASQQNIDICFLDVYLPDGNGLDLLKEVKKKYRNIFSIIMTAHSEESIAINALKIGASDYLKKPLQHSELNNTLTPIYKSESYSELIDEDNLTQLKKLETTDYNFIIIGEAGSGKSTLLERFETKQKQYDFYGWSTDELELSNEIDKLILNFEGVIRLHHLETLSLKNQKQLLMALKKRENLSLEKLRIIGISNSPLQELIAQGLFLPSLYNFIAEAEIHIPHLREGQDRIEKFVYYFAKQFALINNETEREIANCFLTKVKSYNWPGNIRELANFMKKILLGHTESPLVWHPEDGRFFLDYKSEASLKNIEFDYIRSILESTKYNYKKTAEKLGISRSTLYRKMRDQE